MLSFVPKKGFMDLATISSPILMLSQDHLRSIFKYFTPREIERYKMICRLWKSTMENRDVLLSILPSPRYYSLGYVASPNQYIALLNRYQAKLKSANFHNCVSLSDKTLTRFTAKTSSFKFAKTRISANAVIELIAKSALRDERNELLPIKLYVKQGNEFDFSSVLDGLRARGVKIKKLDVGFGACTSNLYTDALNRFIKEDGLVSPCDLDFSNEISVDSSVIDTLIKKNVKVKYINLTACNVDSDDVTRLIESEVLTKDSRLITEDDALEDDFVNALLVKEMKLPVLSLDTENERDELNLVRLIRQGTEKTCQFHIVYRCLTMRIVQAIIESQIEISAVKIVFNFAFAPEESQLAFKELFRRGKFSIPFSFSFDDIGSGKCPAYLDTMLKCLINSHFRIHALELKSSYFPQSIFVEMCQQGVFNTLDLDLDLACENWDPKVVMDALSNANLQVKELKHHLGYNPVDLVSLAPKMMNARYVSFRNVSNPFEMLKLLKKSSIQVITDFNFDTSFSEPFLDCFSDPENFVNLSYINGYNMPLNLTKTLGMLRPGLTINLSQTGFRTTIETISS